MLSSSSLSVTGSGIFGPRAISKNNGEALREGTSQVTEHSAINIIKFTHRRSAQPRSHLSSLRQGKENTVTARWVFQNTALTNRTDGTRTVFRVPEPLVS